MKKVFVISIVMLFALAMMVSAAGSQWVAYVTGTGADGVNGLTIGQLPGATTGLTDSFFDGFLAEPGGAGSQPGTYVDSTSQGAYADVRPEGPQTWTVVFKPVGTATAAYNGPYGFFMEFAMLRATGVEEAGLEIADYTPTGLTFTISGAGLGTQVLTQDQINGRIITFQSVGTGQQTVTITVGPAEPVVPEPGSMLALGSGLVGLVGFAIRRRK